MIGRTHMAIGAAGAVVATPLIMGRHWEPVSRMFEGHWNAIPHMILVQAIFVVATAIGAIIPDLDQQDSLMAHKIETIGRLILIAILSGLVVAMHMTSSIVAWAIVLLLGMLLGTKHNITRMVGLGILAVAIAYVTWHGRIPLAAGVLLVAWMIGAMSTAHRTFTHSVIGLLVFAIGTTMSIHALNHVRLPYAALGLVLGYGLHMAADAIAGGIPLFWPWHKRQGIHLVKTGGTVDKAIGALCWFGFLVLAIA